MFCDSAEANRFSNGVVGSFGSGHLIDTAGLRDVEDRLAVDLRIGSSIAVTGVSVGSPVEGVVVAAEAMVTDLAATPLPGESWAANYLP